MREPALPGRRGDPRCSVLVCALVLQLGWMEGELALSVRQTVLGVRLFWSRCVCARGRAAGTRFTCWRDVCAQSARLWAERATSGTGARNTKACCGYLPLPPAPPLPSRSVPSVFFPGKGGSPQSSAAITRIQRCAFCDRDGRGGRGCRGVSRGRRRAWPAPVLRSVGVGGAGRRRAGIIYSSQRADWLYEQRVPSRRKSPFVFGIVKIKCVCLRACAHMRTRFWLAFDRRCVWKWVRHPANHL